MDSIYLKAGQNTIQLAGEAVSTTSNVIIDNIAIYAVNQAPTTSTSTATLPSYTYLAMASGGNYLFSSAMKDYRDAPLINSSNAWCARVNDQNQYFQISAPEMVNFQSVLLQGYNTCPNSTTCTNCLYIEEIQIQYTLNGSTWLNYQNGAIFAGNVDAVSIMTITLTGGLTCKAIRIVPVTWNRRICARLDAWYTTIV